MKLVAALVVVFGIGGIAAAADIPEEAPLPPPAPERFDWTGFYVGIQGGYEWREDDVEDPVPVPPFATSFNFDGAVLGAHAGYDYQFSNPFVLGVVADIEWADGSNTSSAFGPGVDIFAKAEANWLGSLRARLGYAIDKFLIYATGGLAFANYDFDYTCCFPGGPPVFNLGDQFDETVFGYTIGGGAAVAFSENWNAWADYRYSEYHTASSGIVNCCAGPPNKQNHDIKTHALRLGLSRKF